MKDESINSITQLQTFIKTAEMFGREHFKRKDGKEEIYEWMNDLLIRLKYRGLKKKEKGSVRKYLVLYSGYSESHIDHLISRYMKEGKITRRKRTQPKFETKYTREDIETLAEVAEAYDHQNGRALKEVMREMYEVHGEEKYKRLANISVSRLYDLKKTDRFREQVYHYTKTLPTHVPIGIRQKPYPCGVPGFLRVDSVHQGDKDKEKGVYHINLVDEVTQWEIVVCVEGISEEFLKDALEEAISAFPFVIINFHSDNGSEYINKVVAELLEKLRITQTKSRARRSNDNALAEGKNGSVIRTHTGTVHIPRKFAPDINAYYQKYRNPFLNFHRFCAFADEEIDDRGKIVKKYRTFLTPVSKLLSMRNAEKYLKSGVTRKLLEEEGVRQTHMDAAKEMQRAKTKLFKFIFNRTI